MDLDDAPGPEVAVAVAITAVVASPQVRRLVRRGAIYGLAALLAGGEGLAGVARSLVWRIRPETPMFDNGLEDITWAPTNNQVAEGNRHR